MLRKSIQFGIKNFYKQMGLSQHFTVSGLLRRTERQYPRLYKLAKFSMIFTMINVTSLIIIPGSSLPLQKTLKNWVGQKTEQICNFWYVEAGMANVLTYVMVTFQIIFYSFKNGIQQSIPTYLSKINDTLQANSLNVGRKINNNVKLQNIINSVELLRLFINQFQLTRDPKNLLANNEMLKQYHRVIDNSICKIQGKMKQQQMKQFAMSLKIFQYLIKYENQSKKKQILTKLTILLRDPNKLFLSLYIMKDQEFKNQLKRILMQHPNLRQTIVDLLSAIQAAKNKATQ